VTLTNGSAAFTISTLAVGVHTIAALYTPDTGAFAGSSGSTNQTVTVLTSSTTTLTISPTTTMYGNQTVLTAVVSQSFATGTVSFYEGSTLLGTASVDNTGTAVLPISTLSAGAHNILAKYNGDPIVPASTSNAVQLTVTQRTASGGGPAITITANNASRTATQSNPAFSYSAAGQLVNGDTYATAISGTANYSTAAGTSPGTYSITVAGLTSTNYSIAFAPGTLTVTTAPSSTTVAASSTSTRYGDPVTLTATVPSGATGTVSFYDGSVLIGTGVVTNGVATLITTALDASSHTITAVYNGDATYASSQSAAATVAVSPKTGPGGGPALTVTVQNESREYGTADPQFNYVVTGTLVNGDTYATAVTGAPVYSASDTATSPAGSTFPISVSGLSSKNYATTFVNGTLTIAAASTVTTLTASSASTQYGDSVTLSATVTPSAATGTVVFMEGPNVLGTGAISGGVATLSTSMLPAGSYTITANYLGDSNYSASTTAPIKLTVSPKVGMGGGPALTIMVQNASRAYGQGNPAFAYSVTGTLVNGDTYATAVAGVPVYFTSATPASAAGTYPISILGGLNSSNYSVAFVNGTLTVTNAAPGQNGLDFALTLTSSGTQTVIPGNAATYAIQVAPTNGTYPGTVSLSATGLPSGATISFSPNSVASNGGTQPITVTVHTAAQNAAVAQRTAGPFALAMLLLPFATLKRVRKSSRYLCLFIVLLAGIAAAAGLTGCGYNGNGFFGQTPKTYTITITATSGTIQHSTAVTLNLQ